MPDQYFFCVVECYRPYIETKVDQGGEEDDADKPKSIFQREDLFKDPLDAND